MIESLEQSKYAIGREGNMAWIFDYLRFMANPSISVYDIFWSPKVSPPDEETARKNGRQCLNAMLVFPFLKGDPEKNEFMTEERLLS